MLHTVRHSAVRHIVSAALCAGIPLALPAEAGELRTVHVPADVDWVLHFDMEAVVSSDLWAHARAAGLVQSIENGTCVDDVFDADDASRDELEELIATHGIRWTEDLYSVTLFGRGSDEDYAVVLLELAPRCNAVLEDLREREEHLSIDEDGIALDAWIEEGNEVNGYLHALTIDDRMFVVLGEDRDELVRAAWLLNGKEGSLADPMRRDVVTLEAQPAAGSFLYIEAAGPGLSGIEDDPRSSRIVESAQSLRFDAGESDGSLLAQLTLSTNAPDEARRVAEVVQGVVSLGVLAGSDAEDPQAQMMTELAAGITVSAEGDELHADFAMESKRLVDLMRRAEDAGAR